MVFAITLVAAIAFLLARGGPMAMQQAAGDSQAALALRVAQAGMEHAIWRADHSACTGYALASTPFGAHSYSASYSAASGSPVDITVTATLADGATRALTRRNVAVHQTAVSVSLNEKEDANLSENNPTQNDSDSSLLFIRSDKPGSSDRGLLRFDLAGIPMGARILSASLSLYLYYGSGQAVPIAARRLNQDWVASQATWNVRQSGVNWGQAGGDMDRAKVSTATVGPAQNVRYDWDLTDMVAGWVAGLYPNQGLELTGADASADEAFTTMRAGDPTWRPKLYITYACPCGMVCAAPQGTGKVLLVVSDDANPGGDDQYRKALFESWGYSVTYLDDNAAQSSFDNNLATSDVAYVSESVSSGTLAGKLVATAKGVVYEKGEQNSVLGLASGYGQAMGAGVDLIDNSHPITQGFATGQLAIYRYAMEGLKASGTLAGGAQVLARWGADAGLVAVDKGAALTSGTAAGRRVMLPLGRKDQFNMAYLNNNGRLIVQRALTWAGAAVAAPPIVGLVAHWKLDEMSGSTAQDSAGGHHGTANATTWTTGQLNGALDFNSSSDVVTVPHDATLSLSSFTLSAWIYNRSLSGYDVVINKGASSYQSNYYLGTKDNNISFGWYNGSFLEFNSSGANLQTNTWYHIAVSYDGATGTARLYLNGNLIHQDMKSDRPVTNGTGLVLGRPTWGDIWDGLLDDVRIYDRALSATEVAQLATPGGGGGGGGCSGSFSDEFKAQNYSGSDGTLAWAGNWTEVGESDGATTGDEIVGTDQSNYQLRVRDNDNGGEGVMRQADLSAYTSATLSFDYRRVGLDDSNDWVAVQVSKNNAAWVELGRYKGSGTDTSYQAASYDISAYIAANVRIRFISSSNLGGDDAVWFDNTRITVSGCAP